MTTPTTTQSSVARMPLRPLLLLALAVFVSVTSQFLPAGLLPLIADGLVASEAAVGMLVGVFSVAAVVTAALIPTLLRVVSHKTLLVVALGIMALANVGSWSAPSYELLAGARVIAGLAHGMFFSLSNAYAAHLVPREKLGRALAIITGGLTVSFVAGIPLGTALGQAVGWRLAFLVLAAVIASLTLALMVALPGVPRVTNDESSTPRVSTLKDPSLIAVILAALVVVLALAGHNTFYVYIAPYLIDSAGFQLSAVALLLFVFGAAGAIGQFGGGLLGDRFPRSGAMVTIAIVALALGILGVFPASPVLVVVVLVFWAAAFGGYPPLLHARALRAASPRLRDVSASLLTVGINLGIGSGAVLGGLLYEPLGLSGLAIAGAIVCLAAMAVSGYGDWRTIRQESSL